MPEKNTYPILEFDPTREALIEPSRVIRPRDVPEHCVICFFQEVIDKVVAEQGATLLERNKWEDGPHPLYEINHRGQRLAFFHPGIGGPLAAGLLEEMIAWGCRKFIACGGCGVLAKEIAVGHLILVTSAVRDEGVSYHYLPPAREVVAGETVVQVLAQTMDRLDIPYLRGKTWTTDAPYRETPSKVALRRQDGCRRVPRRALRPGALRRRRPERRRMGQPGVAVPQRCAGEAVLAVRRRLSVPLDASFCGAPTGCAAPGSLRIRLPCSTIGA
jgi:hypothetical protein